MGSRALCSQAEVNSKKCSARNKLALDWAERLGHHLGQVHVAGAVQPLLPNTQISCPG